MSNFKNKIYYLGLLIIFFSVHLDATVVRRAAFDFGSGKSKLLVADVDTETHHVVKTVYATDKAILLSEDLMKQSDHKFSKPLQDQAVAIAQALKNEAIEHGAIEFCGIATEAYRNALNGNELTDRYQKELDIPTTIIPQQTEGKLAFSAVIEEKGLNPYQIVCWDIGGGSFQITYLDQNGEIQVYMGPYGRLTLKHLIISAIKHNNPAEISTPNPMSDQEWLEAVQCFRGVLLPVPEGLAAKLNVSETKLIGVGGHPPALREKGLYNKQDLLDLLQSRLNKKDEELSAKIAAPSLGIVELVLVYGLMENIHADTINYVITKGGIAQGLIISDSFWK